MLKEDQNYIDKYSPYKPTKTSNNEFLKPMAKVFGTIPSLISKSFATVERVVQDKAERQVLSRKK